MSDDRETLRRLQLMDSLRQYPSPQAAAPPPGGWLRTLREALGMTRTQLAARLGITPPSVLDLERSEAERRITLESLDRVANALGCRVVYAVVPKDGSLDEIRERRAGEVADALLQPTGHSMKLEAQGVSERERRRQRKMLIDSLLRGSPRKLWR
jgi:predicted DNA-binding mobile mystery protein A